jgi:putative sterol carrier protein
MHGLRLESQKKGGGLMHAVKQQPTASSDRFFVAIRERGSSALLKYVSGTVRFDLCDGDRVDRWLVTVTKGEVTVKRRNGRADAVVRADQALFSDIVTGRKNAQAAYLRGALAVEGDMRLVVQLLRLLPGPPRAQVSEPTKATGGAR